MRGSSQKNLFFPSLPSLPPTSPPPQPALWKCSLHPPHAFNPGIRRVQPSWKFPKMISLILPECFVSTQWGSRSNDQRGQCGLLDTLVTRGAVLKSSCAAWLPPVSLLHFNSVASMAQSEGFLQLLLTLAFTTPVSTDICRVFISASCIHYMDNSTPYGKLPPLLSCFLKS